MTPEIYSIDPLTDARWKGLVIRHPHASVFHTTGWLQALQKTYSFQPVAITTCEEKKPLQDAIVLCRIRSRLTGNRLVSLPFSDHCDPLTDSADQYGLLREHLHKMVDRREYRSFEIRPLEHAEEGPQPNTHQAFLFHSLDLRPPLDCLWQSFHKDCIQRKIRRAEREKLVYDKGNSDAHLGDFYSLQLLTRHRHKIPPQPFAWFRNLRDCLADDFSISLARLSDAAIAATIHLHFRETMVYKYGCSDTHYNNLGAMPFLFWNMIQEAKSQRLQFLDLGRSEPENQGLVQFKERLGGSRKDLRYNRYPECRPASGTSLVRKLGGEMVSRLPDPIFRLLGKAIYPYLG